MSSIESMISEIEKDYKKLIEMFEGSINKSDPYFHQCGMKTDLDEQKLIELLRATTKLKNKIRYISTSISTSLEKMDVQKLKHGEYFQQLIDSFESQDKQVAFNFRYDVKYVLGIQTSLKLSISHMFTRNQFTPSWDALQQCYCAYIGLKRMKPLIIELEEELRLIGAITTYPISEKIKLKEQLVMNDFEAVAVSLEEAETNVLEEHFRDCVSRCRDAIEIFIAKIRENETAEKTERHFATDLAKIVKKEVFDEAIQRLIQGVYSFLSLKGSHKYEEKRVEIYDAETALKETYSLIEMLLKKYSEYKKYIMANKPSNLLKD